MDVLLLGNTGGAEGSMDFLAALAARICSLRAADDLVGFGVALSLAADLVGVLADAAESVWELGWLNRPAKAGRPVLEGRAATVLLAGTGRRATGLLADGGLMRWLTERRLVAEGRGPLDVRVASAGFWRGTASLPGSCSSELALLLVAMADVGRESIGLS